MRYRRRCASTRTSTRPASLSTRRCLDTAGWLSPSSSTSSPTGRSPSRSLSTMASRRGSPSAWNSAARGMPVTMLFAAYACQGIEDRVRRRPPGPTLLGGRVLRRLEDLVELEDLAGGHHAGVAAVAHDGEAVDVGGLEGAQGLAEGPSDVADGHVGPHDRADGGAGPFLPVHRPHRFQVDHAAVVGALDDR